MIRPQDISVVIQGPVIGKPTDPAHLQFTRRAADSVRRVLPGAQVILSTWKGTDTTGVDADIHLLNEDPGGSPCHDTRPILNNVNRQIVSTRNGIAVADRPYVMKLRSDAILEHPGFLSFVGRYPTGGPGTVVSERILGCTDFTRRPTSRSSPIAYHPGDLWYLGRKRDMMDLWDCPLTREPEFSSWFKHRPRPRTTPALVGLIGFLHRHTPEQYIWLSFLRKHGDYPCDDWTDLRPEVIRRSEQSFAANLVLASPSQLGVGFLKFGSSDVDEWADSLMSHGDWLELYRRYCLGSHCPVLDRVRLAKAIYSAGIRQLRPLYQEFMRSSNGGLVRYLIGRMWDRSASLEKQVVDRFTRLRSGVRA